MTRDGPNAPALLPVFVPPTLCVHGCSPIGTQEIHAAWYGSIEHLGLGNTIGPKVAKTVSQLAPRSYDAAVIPVAQKNRPYQAFGQFSAMVALGEHDLLAASNCEANGGCAKDLFRKVHGRNADGRFQKRGPVLLTRDRCRG